MSRLKRPTPIKVYKNRLDHNLHMPAIIKEEPPDSDFDAFKSLSVRPHITPVSATTPSVAAFGKAPLHTPLFQNHFGSPIAAIPEHSSLDKEHTTRAELKGEEIKLLQKDQCNKGETSDNCTTDEDIDPDLQRTNLKIVLVENPISSPPITLSDPESPLSEPDTIAPHLIYFSGNDTEYEPSSPSDSSLESESSLSEMHEMPEAEMSEIEESDRKPSLQLLLNPTNRSREPSILRTEGFTPGSLVEQLSQNEEMMNTIRKSKKGSYYCNHCHERFLTMLNFAIHLDMLEGFERPYKCQSPDCPWSLIGFMKRSEAFRHTRHQHSGVREFKCEYHDCNKSFARKDSMRRHELQVHMNQRSRLNKLRAKKMRKNRA
uniref:ARAD1D33000p n=1 Tax=Blastobotrys adeninivorans TaxID=409370 RepID=A0A060TBM2_BLAAD